jgi:hypothetical protein
MAITAETQVHARVSPRGTSGGQNGTGTGLSLSSSVLPCQYHSIVALHTHVPSGRLTIDPLVVTVQRHHLAPSTRTTHSHMHWFKFFSR